MECELTHSRLVIYHRTPDKLYVFRSNRRYRTAVIQHLINWMRDTPHLPPRMWVEQPVYYSDTFKFVVGTDNFHIPTKDLPEVVNEYLTNPET